MVMLMLSWKSHSSTMRVTVTSPICQDFMCSLAMPSPFFPHLVIARSAATNVGLTWPLRRLPLRFVPGHALRRQLGRRQCGLAEDEVGCALADHDARRVGVAADDARHDGSVG